MLASHANSYRLKPALPPSPDSSFHLLIVDIHALAPYNAAIFYTEGEFSDLLEQNSLKWSLGGVCYCLLLSPQVFQPSLWSMSVRAANESDLGDDLDSDLELRNHVPHARYPLQDDGNPDDEVFPLTKAPLETRSSRDLEHGRIPKQALTALEVKPRALVSSNVDNDGRNKTDHPPPRPLLFLEDDKHIPKQIRRRRWAGVIMFWAGSFMVSWIAVFGAFKALGGSGFTPTYSTACDLDTSSTLQLAFQVDVRVINNLTFGGAKAVSVFFDFVLGQLGRLLLGFISWRVLSDALTSMMEHSSVSYEVYVCFFRLMFDPDLPV
jgi:hypothetical protein